MKKRLRKKLMKRWLRRRREALQGHDGAALVAVSGPLPESAENLFQVVRIRNLGSSLGFDKIIIKNGMERIAV